MAFQDTAYDPGQAQVRTGPPMTTLPFDELKKILIPPGNPVLTGTLEEWEALEGRLGLRLPTDYKLFVKTYGDGTPNRSFYMISPFSRAPYDLASVVDEHRRTFLEVYREYDDVWEGLNGPVPDGLIPFARDDERGTAFWDTRPGASDLWTIVELQDLYWQFFSGGTAEYLIQAITGSFHSVVYRPPPRKLPVRFQPFRAVTDLP